MINYKNLLEVDSNCNDSGIYVIISKSTKRFYIGSSQNVRKRRNSHRVDLRKQRHTNKHLQNIFNKYGEDELIFYILERCLIKQLVEREGYFLKLYFNKKGNVNLFKEPYAVRGENHPMYGTTHTKVSRRKIKEARSKQTIKHSKETRKKISTSNTGKKHSKESIEKMRESQTGVVPWNKGLTVKDSPSIRSYVEKRETKIPSNKLKKMIAMYREGESINALSNYFKHDWNVIKKTLKHNGIKTRTISEQKIIRDAKTRKTNNIF